MTLINGAYALLKLLISTKQRSPEVVEPWLDIVLTFVPALRTDFKCFVVAFLRVLVDALKTDKAAYAIIKLIKQQRNSGMSDRILQPFLNGVELYLNRVKRYKPTPFNAFFTPFRQVRPD